MKIGIITFHWATNYGAVLQAYALQTYLSQHGYDTQIIDYIPYTFKKNLVKCLITKRPWQIPHNVLDYLKEWRFKEFRTKHLNLSDRYRSFEALKMNPPVYDAYICGSDQIWNPFFTANGERKLTLSYFLDFGPISVKRIAYAVSFGCTQYPKDLLKLASPSVSKFDAVSVRENSGRQIVHEMGIKDVCLMPDPTLLLRAKDYKCLFLPSRKTQISRSFFYSLQSSQKTIQEVKNYFSRRLRRHILDSGSLGNSMMGIETWLAFIKSSDFVITNSFHGVAFAIIFKKPFIVVPIEGSLAGMNDRIFTLLGDIGLQERILERYDENRINTIMAQAIDWEGVDHRIESLRGDAWLFLKKNLS